MKFKTFFPFFILLAVSPFTPWCDLYFSKLSYGAEGFYTNFYFNFLFHWGEIFGLAVGGIALAIFLVSFMTVKYRKWRRGALAIGLTLLIGAGFITNTCLKGHWGRPRPKQIQEFGGNYSYRPFWKPDFHTEGESRKSFPSGHVAMGFYFLSVCFTARRYRSQPLFYLGLSCVIILGGGLMVARVSQGGHFFSDVIFSPVLMWYVALLIDKSVFTWGALFWPVRFLKFLGTFLKLGGVSKV